MRFHEAATHSATAAGPPAHGFPTFPDDECVSGASEPAKITRSKVEAAPAIGTPESSCYADDKLFVRNFCQDSKARTLEPLT